MQTVEFIDPKEALKELQQFLLNNSFDNDNFFKSPKHKKMREQYVALCFCQGYRVYSGKTWYLYMNDSDPPDVRLCYKPTPNEYIFDQLEIMEIPEKAVSRNKLVEKQVADLIVRKKITKPRTGKSSEILCIKLDFDAISFKFDDVAYAIADYNPEYKEIWLSYMRSPVLDDMEKTQFAMFKIWPTIEKIEFCVGDIVNYQKT